MSIEHDVGLQHISHTSKMKQLECETIQVIIIGGPVQAAHYRISQPTFNIVWIIAFGLDLLQKLALEKNDVQVHIKSLKYIVFSNMWIQ